MQLPFTSHPPLLTCHHYNYLSFNLPYILHSRAIIITTILITAIIVPLPPRLPPGGLGPPHPLPLLLCHPPLLPFPLSRASTLLMLTRPTPTHKHPRHTCLCN